MVMITTAPGGVEVPVRTDSRWEQARCRSGRRLLDHHKPMNRVRVWCERCKAHHIFDMGLGAFVDG